MPSAAEPPPGCHIPLSTAVAPMPPPFPPPAWPSYDVVEPPLPPPPPPGPVVPRMKKKSPDFIEDTIQEIQGERHEIELSEFHFLLANPRVRGFRLKDKEWGRCCH